MTVSLFASLSKTKAFSNEEHNEKEIQTFKGGSSPLSSSFSTGAPPAFPPAIVQLYSNKFIDLNQLSIIHMDPHSSLVAPLTYQSLNLSSFSFESYERRSSKNGTTNKNDSTTASNGNSNSNVLGPRLDSADIGIWNCHMFFSSKSNATTSPSKLLQACHPLDSSKKPLLAGETGTRCIVPVFVVVLDLEYDHLGGIHSTMEAMLENIVDYCMTYNPPNESSNDNSRRNRNDGNGTTRLKILLNTRFGKAPLTEEEEEKEEKEDKGGIEANDNEKDNGLGEEHATTTDNGTRSNHGPSSSYNNKQQQKDAKEVYMHLIICGILSSKKDVTYREKQALNLVSYHLQKFASEVNCTLCYMRGDQDAEEEEEEKRKGMVDGKETTGEDKEGGRGGDGMDHVAEVVREDGFRPKGLSVVEFAKSICNVYHGDDSGAGETGQDDLNALDVNVTSSSNNGWHQQPSFYGPFDYDVDLINSVLLRGAGCPGVWNANTDSLWVALPLPPSSSSSPSASLLPLSPLQNDNSVENHATKSSNLAKGDQEWLEKLAESVNLYAGTTSGGASEGKSVKSSMDQTIRTTRTSANNTVATKKKVVKKKPSATGDKKGGDSQDVQDFFAGLLNK